MAIAQRQPAAASVTATRPILDLFLLVALGAVAGTVLVTAADTAWLDGVASAVPDLHSNVALNRAMVGVTRFGEEVILLAAFAGATLLAFRRRGPAWGRFFAVVGVGALTIDNLIKPLVGRSRPVFDQLVGGRGDSFPSGHVTATTALLVAAAWYAGHGRTPAVRRALWVGAAGGGIAMAVSRVYLGVHWPTDVLAGLLLGTTWTWMAARSQLGAEVVASRVRARSHRGRAVPVLASLVLFGVACSPSTGPSEARAPTIPGSQSDTYDPDINPADFVAEIDNRYFPLVPGTVFKLKGATEDGIERETITVTHRTREVMGVHTTVVRDVARVDGEVAEFTYDWYAQDSDGNVWYFGENTAEMEEGEVVNRHGSWEAGVDGALPGIIMNADPQVLDSHRQEYYEGEAEDMYWVVADGETAIAPAGTFEDAIRTLEWNPLEPRIVVEKLYAPGVGLVAERALSGGKEIVKLLSVTGP
jgi:membrane-associated phospholipid phosphatase